MAGLWRLVWSIGPPAQEEAVGARLRAWSLALSLTLGVMSCAPGDVPSLRERAQQAWNEVLHEYHQRADQVPLLVEAVRKKAPVEREVLDAVMAAHDEVVAIRNADGFLAEPERFRHYEQAQQRLLDALERLYTTIKRYPELTGDTALQNRLHDLQRQDDQLVIARSDLIGAVRAHNEQLGRFPGGWIAAIIDAKAKPLTAFAQAEIEQAPTPAKP
jgi:LemA protein